MPGLIQVVLICYILFILPHSSLAEVDKELNEKLKAGLEFGDIMVTQMEYVASNFLCYQDAEKNQDSGINPGSGPDKNPRPDKNPVQRRTQAQTRI